MATSTPRRRPGALRALPAAALATAGLLATGLFVALVSPLPLRGDPAQPADPRDAATWPGWRGPRHDGLSSESDALAAWPPGGPRRLWKVSVGEGFSSVAVGGGRVFTMGNARAEDSVWCLDAATGATVWRYSYPCRSSPGYPGPRATPTLDGNRVYAVSAKGHVTALDVTFGAVAWVRDVTSLPGAQPPQYDFSTSAVVLDSLLVLNMGTAGLALDKATGSVAWQSANGQCSYASPVPFETRGQPAIALFGIDALLALNPANGQVLWQFPWKTSFGANVADPVVVGDKVFISSGYGTGCALLKHGEGNPEALWQNKELKAHFANCVYVQNHLFGLDGNVGEAGSSLRCLDPATGQVKWSQPGLSGSLCATEDRLLVLTLDGELVLVEASPKGYHELGRAHVLGGRAWSLPVLCGGRVFCRNVEGELICLDLRGGS
ncbi:MAG: PQQ-binding-like beta-propeller repeat protein [Planctomycetes bacterium]|nr:PQQ-binding-like beta-propeller repeat protein [Planctomycetota bacterium]